MLSLQNGLGNLDLIRAAGHERVILGVTAHGAALLGQDVCAIPAGRDAHRRSGATGQPSLRPDADQPRIPALAWTAVAENIHTAIWDKLIVNVAINALTALTGLRNGELLDDPDLQPVIAQLVTGRST